MRTQKGSILVGVLAMGIAMTMAASGYILVAGNAANTELTSTANLQLQYAAESGMLMGIRWVKTYPPEKINDATWANNVVLTQDVDFPGTAGWAVIDGYRVKVLFASPSLGFHDLDVWATAGTGNDTVKLHWQINLASTSSPPQLSLSRWTETVIPGK